MMDKEIINTVIKRDDDKKELRFLRSEIRRVKKMTDEMNVKSKAELERLEVIEDDILERLSWVTNQELAEKFDVDLKYIIRVSNRRFFMR